MKFFHVILILREVLVWIFYWNYFDIVVLASVGEDIEEAACGLLASRGGHAGAELG